MEERGDREPDALEDVRHESPGLTRHVPEAAAISPCDHLESAFQKAELVRLPPVTSDACVSLD